MVLLLIYFYSLETWCSLHEAGASHSNAQALPNSPRLPTRPGPQLSCFPWQQRTTSERHYRHVIMSFTHLAVAQNCFDTWTHKMLFIRKNCQVHPLFWDSEFDPGQIWTKNGQTIPPRENEVAQLYWQPSSAVSPFVSTTLGSRPLLIRYLIVSTWPLRAT